MDKFRKGNFRIFGVKIRFLGGQILNYLFWGQIPNSFLGTNSEKNSIFSNFRKFPLYFDPYHFRWTPTIFPHVLTPYHFRRSLTIFPKMLTPLPLKGNFTPVAIFGRFCRLPLLFSPYHSRSPLPFPQFFTLYYFCWPPYHFRRPPTISQNINIFVAPYHFDKILTPYHSRRPPSTFVDPYHLPIFLPLPLLYTPYFFRRPPILTPTTFDDPLPLSMTPLPFFQILTLTTFHSI